MIDIVPSDTPQGKHYTYTLSYPESMGGRVFYVGKGQGRRLYMHESDARLGKGPNPHKNNIIKKIWKNGEEVVKTILAYFDTSEEACMYEIALIFFMDGLANLASGGEGAAGVPHSEETRKKISENTKRQMQDEKARQRLREVNTGKRHSEETRRKIGEAGKGRTPPNKGIPLSEEQKARLLSYTAGVKQKPETVEKRAASNRGKKRLPETGQKISAAKMGHSVSEETKQKLREKRKEYKLSPETYQKIALANTGKKRSEETRRKLSMPRPAGKGKTPWNKGKPMSEEQKAKMRGRKRSDETRRKLSESHKGQMPSNLEQLKEMSRKRAAEKRARTFRTYPRDVYTQGRLFP